MVIIATQRIDRVIATATVDHIFFIGGERLTSNGMSCIDRVGRICACDRDPQLRSARMIPCETAQAMRSLETPTLALNTAGGPFSENNRV